MFSLLPELRGLAGSAERVYALPDCRLHPSAFRKEFE